MTKQNSTRTRAPRARTKAASAMAIEAVSPSHEQIARRAFELYVARDGLAGSDVSDWLRAEAELREASAPS